MHRLTFFLLLVSYWPGFSVSAQGTWYAGAFLRPQYTTLWNADDAAAAPLFRYAASYDIAGGMEIQHEAGLAWRLSASLVFSSQGQKFTSDVRTGSGVDHYRGRKRFHYLKFPVGLKYGRSDRGIAPFLALGIQAEFLLKTDGAAVPYQAKDQYDIYYLIPARNTYYTRLLPGAWAGAGVRIRISDRLQCEAMAGCEYGLGDAENKNATFVPGVVTEPVHTLNNPRRPPARFIIAGLNLGIYVKL